MGRLVVGLAIGKSGLSPPAALGRPAHWGRSCCPLRNLAASFPTDVSGPRCIQFDRFAFFCLFLSSLRIRLETSLDCFLREGRKKEVGVGGSQDGGNLTLGFSRQHLCHFPLSGKTQARNSEFQSYLFIS